MTLVELIAVAVIAGVLAAVAVVSYRNHVIRSQRSEAKDALLALAMQQEKHFLRCSAYARAIAESTNCAAGELQGTAASRNGWYTLAIPAASATSFTVRATASAGQDREQDTACRTFDVSDRGVRRAADSDGADNTAECWR